MSKHTPGPWQLGMGTSTCHYVCAVNENTVVCSDISTADNARLIAAAPELKAVVQMVANLGENGDLVNAMAKCLHAHERDSFIKLFREDARAAIAKATWSAE